MPPAVAPTPPATDARVAAFCSSAGPDVFSGIVHGNQIWTPDPFDVDTIHADAREAFARLLNRASSAEPPAHGKTLLLLGEGGSGKTHLMRAFRTATHDKGIGYCGYLQMAARTDNYHRYLLSNLIDSLEQPYKPGHPDTGLHRLARGVLDALACVPAADRAALSSDCTLEPDDLARLVHRFADLAVQTPRFRGIDIDVIRAVLYTLANDGRVRPRVLKWLRCEDLGKYDRELIGDLVPRPHPEMPQRTIVALGRLMYVAQTAALVLLVDQLEETVDVDWFGEKRGEQFRSAVNALVDLADALPNVVVVIGCLRDLFDKGKEFLPGTKRDRLGNDPEPIALTGNRTPDEIRAVIARRLEVFFGAVGVATDPAAPLAPYWDTVLRPLAGKRTRDVLHFCLNHRAACIAAKTWVPLDQVVVNPQGTQSHPANWDQKWNDFHTAYNAPILGDEPQLATLLAFAIRAASAEMPAGVHFGADPDGRFVPVEVHGPGNTVDKLYVAVCDRTARGGTLGKQVEEVVKKAGEIPAAFVRSTPFPNSPGAGISKRLAGLVPPRGKGRKVVVENSDWRAMAAFREFHKTNSTAPGFDAWQRASRPVGQLRAVQAILALDKLLAALPTAPVVPPPPPPPPAGLAKDAPPPLLAPPPPEAKAADAPVYLGQTRGAVPAGVSLRPTDLCRHAAFLGGSGSGKTTAALTVIEQLLLAGVPAVLLDRKGDLARYADPAAWTAPELDLGRAARRAQLRAAVDVRLYTPGAPTGRPLAIPVVPPDLGHLPAAEQEQMAQFAAAALGVMLGYRSKAPDPKLVILQKAIEVLGGASGPGATVKTIHQLIADQDDALLCAVEGFEDKHFKRLAQDLLALAHQHRRLLEVGAPLDVDALLGRGPGGVPGKTRLTVISTQFIGDPATTDFWVSQLLLAVDRWRTKNPSTDGALQAVFLFDEADQYLPAGGKVPATKGPMESLLKRARSAGIGIFLATQSPGDFDYKCRDNLLTWLIGKVKEPVAIAKLKPMLEAGRADVAGRLPGQETGQFYLVRETDVSPVRVDRNLIPASQVPEDRILALARGRRAGG